MRTLTILAAFITFSVSAFAQTGAIPTSTIASNEVAQSDANIQRELTGTWVANTGDLHVTLLVRSDGSFKTESPNITIRTEGTFLFKDGVLTQTITKSNKTNAPLPIVNVGHIIHIDDQKLVLVWNGISQNLVLRKVKK